MSSGFSVRVNMLGKKCGKLTVISYAYTKNKKSYWNCVCDCGNHCVVHGTRLRNGQTKSCGCLLKDVLHQKKIFKPHYHKIYKVWSNMKRRCEVEKDLKYRFYGAVGVSVCDEWNDFQSFYNWCISSGYAENLTIDRINSKGNYEPSNCRWITLAEQQRNKRNNVYITVDGTTRTITDWSRFLGVTRHSIRYWIEKLNGDSEGAIRHYLESEVE